MLTTNSLPLHLFVLLVASGCAVAPPARRATVDAFRTVSAEELSTAYANNSTAADVRFKNRHFAIQGTVTASNYGTITFAVGSGPRIVVTRSETVARRSLPYDGEVIVVRGTCVGLTLPDTIGLAEEPRGREDSVVRACPGSTWECMLGGRKVCSWNDEAKCETCSCR